MKRRSFFHSLVKAAAIVALAPQLAFRIRPELPATMEPNPEWTKSPLEIFFMANIHALDDLKPDGPQEIKVGEWSFKDVT